MSTFTKTAWAHSFACATAAALGGGFAIGLLLLLSAVFAATALWAKPPHA